jgi:hypothetical protein
MDPVTAGIVANIAYKILEGASSRLRKIFSEHEIERAARKTAGNHEGVTQADLLEAILSEDIGSLQESINYSGENHARSLLVENLDSILDDDQKAKVSDKEAVIDDFLENIQTELTEANPEYFRRVQSEALKHQGEQISKILERVDEIYREIQTGEGEIKFGDELKIRKNASAPEVEIKNHPEFGRNGPNRLNAPIQDRLQPTFIYSLEVTNIGDALIKDFEILLDYFYITHHNRWYIMPIMNKEEDDLIDYTSDLPGEIYHLQTSLPITRHREFRLAAGETIEVDLFAMHPVWTGFLVPTSPDLSEFAFAHRYGSENPDAPFPGEEWWVADREISQWISGRSGDDLLCLLRAKGTDFASQYAILEFNWDECFDARQEWRTERRHRLAENDTSDRIPPEVDNPPLLDVKIHAIDDPQDYISQPLDLDSLEKSREGIPLSTIEEDRIGFESSPIELVGEIQDELPYEEISPATGAGLSAYLSNFDELKFSLDEYLSSLVARRLRDRDDAPYYSIFDVVEELNSDETGLRDDFDSGDSGILNPDIPTLDQITRNKREIPNLKISSSALEDLRGWTTEDRSIHLNDMKILLMEMPSREIFPLPSDVVNRNLYRFATEGGIVFWINPESATAFVPGSVSEITVEASIEADIWYDTADALLIQGRANICSEFCRFGVNTDVFPREPIERAIQELDLPTSLTGIPGIGDKVATQLRDKGIENGVDLAFAYACIEKRVFIEDILEDLPKNHEDKIRNYANKPWQHIYHNFS